MLRRRFEVFFGNQMRGENSGMVNLYYCGVWYRVDKSGQVRKGKISNNDQRDQGVPRL